MALEDQAVKDPDMDARIAAYIRDHVKDRDLWAENDLFQEPDDATPLEPEEREGLLKLDHASE